MIGVWIVAGVLVILLVAWMIRMESLFNDCDYTTDALLRRMRAVEDDVRRNKPDALDARESYDQRIALADYLGIEWVPTKIQAGKWIRKEKKK